MAKDTFYFSHDYGSRNDPKLQRLMMVHGMSGIGIFWCLVEVMYEQEGRIMQTHCDGIAFALHINKDALLSVLNDFDLFLFDGECYQSNSINERLDQRKQRSIIASKSAQKRWGNANALPMQCQPNAIKEKESKEKESKVNNLLSVKLPNINDIEARCIQINLPVEEGRKFYDYYQSNGWMVGKNKMKSWVHALSNWNRNFNEKQQQTHGVTKSASQRQTDQTLETIRRVNEIGSIPFTGQ